MEGGWVLPIGGLSTGGGWGLLAKGLPHHTPPLEIFVDPEKNTQKGFLGISFVT